MCVRYCVQGAVGPPGIPGEKGDRVSACRICICPKVNCLPYYTTHMCCHHVHINFECSGNTMYVCLCTLEFGKACSEK